MSSLATNLMVYEQIATSAGRRVVVRSLATTEDARPSLQQCPADLVLGDLYVPGLDGNSFIRWLTFQPEAAGTPAIVVMPCKDDRLRAEALDAGAVHVWAAPLAPVECRAKVRNLLRFVLAGRGSHLAGTGLST